MLKCLAGVLRIISFFFFSELIFKPRRSPSAHILSMRLCKDFWLSTMLTVHQSVWFRDWSKTTLESKLKRWGKNRIPVLKLFIWENFAWFCSLFSLILFVWHTDFFYKARLSSFIILSCRSSINSGCFIHYRKPSGYICNMGRRPYADLDIFEVRGLAK